MSLSKLFLGRLSAKLQWCPPVSKHGIDLNLIEMGNISREVSVAQSKRSCVTQGLDVLVSGLTTMTRKPTSNTESQKYLNCHCLLEAWSSQCQPHRHDSLLTRDGRMVTSQSHHRSVSRLCHRYGRHNFTTCLLCLAEDCQQTCMCCEGP